MATTGKVITIDGPAGAGKSSVAGKLADRLGWRLLDTGAMYRAVALAALRAGVDLQGVGTLGELAGRIHVRLPIGRVLLDGEDVTSAIRSIDVTRATRHSADCPSVRKLLVGWQRDFAESEGDVVAEGRDQGTIVFPDAYRKFYLTANVEERARRRHAEFAAKGESIPFEAILREVRERDDQDASRSIAPMKPADDARIIDCSDLGPDRVVDLMEAEVLRSVEHFPR